MLDRLNNSYVILISIFLLIIIIKKIYNLNKPFDEKRFMEQCINQEKLKNKFNLNSIPLELPKLTSYYIGLN
jgi:hypothetical protein